MTDLINFRVQFESTKTSSSRRTSSQTRNCDDTASAQDVELRVAQASRSTEFEALSGQDKVYGVDGEEVVITIRTSEEPDE